MDLSFTREAIEQAIHARFAHVASQLGAREALTGDGRRWTYATLDRSANRLAHAVLSRCHRGLGASPT